MRDAPLVPVRSTTYPGCLYLHDLAFVGGVLHGAAAGMNAIVAFEADGGFRPAWWPRCVERRGKPFTSRNQIQLNSIAAGESLASSAFTASADSMTSRRPGQRNFPVDGRGVVFDGATREPVLRGLTRPHSARRHFGRLYVADSGYGTVVAAAGGRAAVLAKLPGWTRGLAFAGGTLFAATSRVIPRFRKYAPGLDVDASECGIHAVDPVSGRLLGSLVWPWGNQVFAVEPLPPGFASGLPFDASRPGATSRHRRLFYTFAAASAPRKDA